MLKNLLLVHGVEQFIDQDMETWLLINIGVES